MRVTSIRDIAALVQGRRHELGLSQEQLARRSGISRKWVYEFEGGKPTAELGLLLRVLDALDLELDLGRANDRPLPPGPDLDALLDDYRGQDRES